MYHSSFLFFLTVLFKYSSSVEYNAAINAIVKTSSQDADHPISFATDLDLNTYFQSVITTTHAWVQYDLGGNVDVKEIIFWMAYNNNEQTGLIYTYVRKTNNVNYDAADRFCAISNYVKNQMLKCSPDQLTITYGRYILIRAEYVFLQLSISEIAIVNEDIDFRVTTFGQVIQSNVYKGNQDNQALNAINGDLITCINTATDVISDRSKAGWWRVDMMREYNISAVEINEYNTNSSYFGFYSIYILTNDLIINNLFFYNDSNLCNQFKQITTNETRGSNCLKLTCNRLIKGRYLAVVRNSDYRPDALNFCEINIYALHNFVTLELPYSAFSRASTTSFTFSNLSTSTKLFSTFTLTIPRSATSLSKSFATNSYSLISTLADHDNFTKDHLKMPESTHSCENEKVVIGVVVGILSGLFWWIIGLICEIVIIKNRPDYCYKKKKEMSVIYEGKSTSENHIYDGLNKNKN